MTGRKKFTVHRLCSVRETMKTHVWTMNVVRTEIRLFGALGAERSSDRRDGTWQKRILKKQFGWHLFTQMQGRCSSIDSGWRTQRSKCLLVLTGMKAHQTLLLTRESGGGVAASAVGEAARK